MFKRRFIITVILIGFLCQAFFSVAAQKENGGDCDDSVNTVEMQMCLGQRLEKAGDLMDRQMNRLMSCLTSGQQERLREAQKAWVLYRNRNAAFEAGQEEGGTLYLLDHLAVLVEMTEKRVHELEELYLRFGNKDLK